MEYQEALRRHYEACWGGPVDELVFERGPMRSSFPEFGVLRFAPTAQRGSWVYATSGLAVSTPGLLELHVRARTAHDAIVESMTVVAHYHATGAALGLHHSVNLGRPWVPGSPCSYAYLSLPYVDGPALEDFAYALGPVRCLWLVPLTAEERDVKAARGVEELEQRFDAADPDLADLLRESVVA